MYNMGTALSYVPGIPRVPGLNSVTAPASIDSFSFNVSYVTFLRCGWQVITFTYCRWPYDENKIGTGKTGTWLCTFQ